MNPTARETGDGDRRRRRWRRLPLERPTAAVVGRLVRRSRGGKPLHRPSFGSSCRWADPRTAARAFALALMLGLALGGVAQAVEPSEMLKDAALEARARKISAGLRCLVCQNESIDDSGAPLAHDIRVLVRQRLEAGDTDGQVRDYLVARYGQFVLLRPPLETQTLLLWGTPLIVLVLGGIAILVAARRRPTRDPSRPLSDAEQRRLNEIVGSS